MGRIYFDNAATSFPKPEAVADAVYRYISEQGCNINRGGYPGAYDVEETVYETREWLCDLFHGEDARSVVFTRSVTESLNVLLKGFLRPGDHVLVSSMEHNAVMRPLTQLRRESVAFSRVPANPDGSLNLDEMAALLTERTRAVVMTHASNVCGTVLPVARVGAFCADHGLTFIVDSAQSAGVLPIDMREMRIDALAFTGHKGLLGPQGVGGFLLRSGLETAIEPLISGGTGSVSYSESVPEFMPDRFEAGTLNLPGIMGLHAALGWIRERGIDAIYAHEMALTEAFLVGLRPLANDGRLRVVGRPDLSGRTGVVSVQLLHTDQAEAADRLVEAYGVMTRVGLHCAPGAHKALGTFPDGTIRFSFGWRNTLDEVGFAVKALEKLSHGV